MHVMSVCYYYLQKLTLYCKFIRYLPVKIATQHFLELTFLSNIRPFQLHRKPLTALEFVTPLARIDPIYKEEEEQFKVNILSS